MIIVNLLFNHSGKQENNCKIINTFPVISPNGGMLDIFVIAFEELDGPAVSALRRAIAEVKQCWPLDG
jgi:hypothetical protein